MTPPPEPTHGCGRDLNDPDHELPCPVCDPPEPGPLGTVDRIVLTDASTGHVYADTARDPEFRRRVLPDQPEPIPDLTWQHDLARCPRCNVVVTVDPPGVHPDAGTADVGWRCDHCRITWVYDGTGGQQA